MDQQVSVRIYEKVIDKKGNILKALLKLILNS